MGGSEVKANLRGKAEFTVVYAVKIVWEGLCLSACQSFYSPGRLSHVLIIPTSTFGAVIVALSYAVPLIQPPWLGLWLWFSPCSLPVLIRKESGAFLTRADQSRPVTISSFPPVSQVWCPEGRHCLWSNVIGWMVLIILVQVLMFSNNFLWKGATHVFFSSSSAIVLAKY